MLSYNSIKLLTLFFFVFILCSTENLCASSSTSTSIRNGSARDKEKAFVAEAKVGNLGYVEKALADRVSVDAVDHTGSSALHYAAQEKNVPLAQLLIERGAYVNSTNKVGQTPLHKAVRDDQPSKMEQAEKLVKLLLSNGARIDIMDINTCKPLEYALKGTFTTIVQMLINLETPQTSTLISTTQPASNSLKRKAINETVKAGQESDSDSNEEELEFDGHCSLHDPKSRAVLYKALKKNDPDLVKKIFFHMALERVARPRNLRDAYATLTELLPSFNTILKDAFPFLEKHSHVEMLCRYTLTHWRDAFMLIFFDELKRGILKPIPAVREATPYAVEFLVKTIIELLQELTPLISREKPRLLRCELRYFLDPNQTFRIFESLLQEEISLKIEKNVGKESSSSSIFDRIALIEREHNSKKRVPRAGHSPDVF